MQRHINFMTRAMTQIVRRVQTRGRQGAGTYQKNKGSKGKVGGSDMPQAYPVLNMR